MLSEVRRFLGNCKRQMISLRRAFVLEPPPLYHKISFSLEGEDMILACLYHGKGKGFYVDVGAHHPKRFSNTYYFYLKGWRGINIDARPGSMMIFNETRMRDINLEVAISNIRQNLVYYSFDEPALNSFNKELADENNSQGKYRIISQREIETRTLADVLDEHLPQSQRIDFLNIDVEGLDYEVLQSNDWGKYRPDVVLVEALKMSTLAELFQSDLFLFMTDQKYELHCKTINTLIFKKKD
jgi:FkbM family methyltransferase